MPRVHREMMLNGAVMKRPSVAPWPTQSLHWANSRHEFKGHLHLRCSGSVRCLNRLTLWRKRHHKELSSFFSVRTYHSSNKNLYQLHTSTAWQYWHTEFRSFRMRARWLSPVTRWQAEPVAAVKSTETWFLFLLFLWSYWRRWIC